MSERFNDGIIDLSQFRKEKEEAKAHVPPFFNEPCKIEFEDEEGKPVFYQLMMNIVYNDRQVVVIEAIDENEVGNGQIGIAEAIIQDGQFYGIKGIDSEEEFQEIAAIITDVFTETEEAEPDEPTDN